MMAYLFAFAIRLLTGRFPQVWAIPLPDRYRVRTGLCGGV